MKNFKPIGIPGYGENYLCSEEGQVYSLAFKKIMKGRDIHGSYKVSLRKHGEKHAIAVGRVIACTFIPNPENKPQIHHINHDNTDNRVINLKWVTPGEHGKLTILNRRTFKTRKIGMFIGDKVVKEYQSIREAAVIMKTTSKGLSRVLHGQRKHHRGYGWRYLDVAEDFR